MKQGVIPFAACTFRLRMLYGTDARFAPVASPVILAHQRQNR
jgi:hypothetical protein